MASNRSRACAASLPYSFPAVFLAGAFLFSLTSAGQITPSTPVLLNTDATADTGVDYVVDLVTDGAGTWLAVWQSDEDRGGAGLDFDIYASRSTDNGATWTAPVFVNSNAASDTGNDEAPALATDGAGNWIAVWSSSEDLGGAGTDFDILWAASADDGDTWSGPFLLNSSGSSDTGHDFNPAIATDGGDNWIVAWHSMANALGNGTDGDILYAVTADDGAVWSAIGVVNSTAASDTGFDGYVQLATDRAGVWTAVWLSSENHLSSGTDSDIFVARSTDNGSTWSATDLLNSTAASDTGEDVAPALVADSSGNWVVVWSSNQNLNGAGADYDIFVAHSGDDAATWGATALLNSNAATDSGDDFTPAVKTDEAGNWVAVWESGENIGSTGADFDLFVARSIDTGTTWGTPEPLTTNAAADSGEDYNVAVATDLMGQWLAAWESSEDTGSAGLDFDIFAAPIVLDVIPFTVSIGSPSETATRTGPVNFPITYTGASVIHLTAGDVSLNATGNATGTISVQNGTTPTPTVIVSSISGDGTLGISIGAGTAEDLGMTAAPAAGPSDTFTVDNTPPAIVLGAPSASLTRTGPVQYPVTYTGASTVNLTLGSLSLVTTGTATGTLSVANGTTSTPTVTISSTGGNGTLGFTIASGTASDALGNLAALAGPSTTFTVDNLPPTVTIGSPSSATTGPGPVTYTVTYGGASAINLLAANVTLTKTGTANASVSVENGTSPTPTVRLSTITGDGTLAISIAAGTATDAAGNVAAGTGPSTPVTVMNNTAPSIALTGGNLTLECAIDAFVEPGFTASDSEDGVLTGNVVVGGDVVNANALGVYTITYNVTDSGGLMAAQRTRVVTVVDTTAPTIALNGANPVLLHINSAYVDPGASASDACDTNLPAVQVNASAVNGAAEGIYAVSYSVTDASGNTGTASRRVVVVNTAQLPAVCSLSLAQLQQQLTALQAAFMLPTTLVSGDVPEAYALLLGRTLHCKLASTSWGASTLAAFEHNAVVLKSEASFANLQPYHAVLALLLSTTSARQAALVSALAAKGVNLTGTYVAVLCTDGVCSPVIAKAANGDGTGGSSFEPFAPDADFDNDGTSNATEYQNTIGALGGANYFVHAVLTSSRRGNEAVSALRDVNADGVVNAVDVQLTINAALGIDILPQFADTNLDGQVNAVDIQRVINAALGL